MGSTTIGGRGGYYNGPVSTFVVPPNVNTISDDLFALNDGEANLIFSVHGAGFGSFNPGNYPTTGTVSSFTIVSHNVTVESYTFTTPVPVGDFIAMLQANTPSAIAALLYAGDDYFVGSRGHDVIHGYDGNDSINGDGATLGVGDDQLFGGDGNDTLDGWGGRDELHGDAGDDTLYAYATELVAGEVFDGGDGEDVILGLDLGNAYDLDFSGITLSSIERVEFAGAEAMMFSSVHAGNGLATDLAVRGSDDVNLFGFNVTSGHFNLSNAVAGYVFQNWTLGQDYLVVNSSGGGSIVGSGFDDILNGGAPDETLSGGGGDDILDGGAGNDVLSGGTGNDTLRYSSLAGSTGAFFGDDGTDTVVLSFEGGDSEIFLEQVVFASIEGFRFETSGLVGVAHLGPAFAGGFNLLVTGTSSLLDPFGSDRISISTAVSTINLSAWQFVEWNANDFVNIRGWTGNQTIAGTTQSDRIDGYTGDDTLDGGAGVDMLMLAFTRVVGNAPVNFSLDTSAGVHVNPLGGTYTNFEAVSLRTGDGADTLTGTAADDIINPGGGEDVIFGGGGVDTVSYTTEALSGGVFVHLGWAWARDNFGTEDRVNDFENIEGSFQHDVLIGWTGDTWIWGSWGNDWIEDISDGNDVLQGEEGDDVVWGAAGDDYLFGGDGADALLGGEGEDYLEGDAGVDWIYSGAGSDYVLGGDGDDVLFGNEGGLTDPGSDVLVGGEGIDALIGEYGDDYLFGDEGDDWAYGGEGNDNLDGGDGSDRLAGENGNDLIFGGAGDDFVYGAYGDDYVDGGDGNDWVDGSFGADIIYGGMGADSLFGGGSDRFVYLDVAESTEAVTDVIGIFWRPGGDKIDVSAINARESGADWAFVLVEEFSGNAGELVITWEAGNNRSVARFDVTGDGISDMTIVVLGVELIESDFML